MKFILSLLFCKFTHLYHIMNKIDFERSIKFMNAFVIIILTFLSVISWEAFLKTKQIKAIQISKKNNFVSP